jgi:hypothetical protein
MLLHLAWNVGVLACGGAFPDFGPAAHPRVALPAALVLAVSVATFLIVAGRLRGARHGDPSSNLDRVNTRTR